MSFIVVTVSDWHCCNIDYHKSNTLDRNKQYISKNKVWSGTIFWKPFAVVRRQFPFPDCFLFRTVRLQRPGISLWLIAQPKSCVLDRSSRFNLYLWMVYRLRISWRGENRASGCGVWSKFGVNWLSDWTDVRHKTLVQRCWNLSEQAGQNHEFDK